MSDDLISRQAALYELHLLSIEALKKHRFDYDALITICSKKIKEFALCSVRAEDRAVDNLFGWVLSILFNMQKRAEKQNNDRLLPELRGVYERMIENGKI